MVYKIVKGNSFVLHVLLQKTSITQDKQTLEDMNVSQITRLRVYLNDMFGEEIDLKTIRYDMQNSPFPKNDVQVIFPSNIDVGIYGITIKGVYESNDFCIVERNLFSIVYSNEKTSIPMGVIAKSIGGMYNAKYWMAFNKVESASDLDRVYYGASSTSNYELVDLTELTEETAKLNNRFIKIGTTEEKPYIWFVSTSPLAFMQASIEIAMNCIIKNGMYYYSSDQLVAGDDNTYFVTSI